MSNPFPFTLFVAVLAGPLAACQTAAPDQPGPAMAATQTQLEAEARAFGATQGAVGMATAWDPTGAASLVTVPVAGAAHKAWLASVQARTRAAQEADLQATYRKYGMNPDGTPSGKPGTGSAP